MPSLVRVFADQLILAYCLYYKPLVTQMCDESVNFSTLEVRVLKLGACPQQLEQLKQDYSQINYAVVLPYMPGKKTEYDDYSDIMLPEGIEAVRPR